MDIVQLFNSNSKGGSSLFGYVRPFQPEMRLKEHDAYKSVYCGLCKELGRSYGIFARATLSYDFTFLAILSMSVQKASSDVTKIRCLVNPLKKCTCCKSSRITKQVTAMAMITLYYKCVDQIQDERSFGRFSARLLLPFARHAQKKAAAQFPVYDQLAREMMDRQSTVETQHAGPDPAAEPTAQYLSSVCQMLSEDPIQQRVLQRFGYLLGRYVYLIDALDDLEKDWKKNRFNPYFKENSLSDLQQYGYQPCVASINGTIGEIAKTFELLDLDEWKSVLSNVVYYGLSNSLQMILQKKERNHDRSL